MLILLKASLRGQLCYRPSLLKSGIEKNLKHDGKDGVNNDTQDQYVKEGLSALEETTVHQTYTTNEDIKARSVTESYAGLNNETQNQPIEGRVSIVKETTIHQTFTTNEDIKAKTVTEGYADEISEPRRFNNVTQDKSTEIEYSTVKKTTTLQSYTTNENIEIKSLTGRHAGLNNGTQDQPTEGELSTVKGTTVHQTNTTNENIIIVKSVTENYATDIQVSSTYKNELRKELTTSLSTGSNEESSTTHSQYVYNINNDTLSTLTKANESKEELYLIRQNVTTDKSYTYNSTHRDMDDSLGLTTVHVSAIISGIIGITVICIVIFIVFKLKKKRALAEKPDYSYVNAAYQPTGSQNCENEPIFTE